jgi:hypothetical protein
MLTIVDNLAIVKNMNSQTAQTITTADESAIRDFLHQMIDAWNRGSGEDFAAPFSRTADFSAFEGTHLKGRKNKEFRNDRE